MVHFPNKPKGSLVPLIAGWVWASLLLVTAFCAQLNTLMVLPDLETKFDTMEEFLEEDFTWGRAAKSPDDPTGLGKFVNEVLFLFPN